MNRASVAPFPTSYGALNLDQVCSFIKARRVAVASAITLLVATIVYLRTMMPGPAFMDTGEFQTVTYVLGVAHPTGYPLYTIVGKIFGTVLPLGSWAWRMNLMSVLSASIAASMLTVLALRFRASPLVAVIASLGFAFSLNTWRAAGHADPYTLTVMMGAALWLMAVKWSDTGERRWLWMMALLSGVGLGSAGVLSMELPAIILYLIASQPRKFFWPPTMIVAGLLGVIGLVGIYLYLPLRASMHPPLNYGNTYTWAGFQFVALGGQVGGIINYLTWEGLRVFLKNLPQVVGWYNEWLTSAGLALVSLLSIVGLGVLLIRDWRLAICAALGVIIPVYPTLTMPINDTTHYVLISNWLLFFLSAIGLEALVVSPLRKLEYGSFRQALLPIVFALLIWLPIGLARVNWSSADMHDYHDADLLARAVFAKVKPNAVVFCWWGPSNALWYGHYVEGLRPDVDVYDDSTTLDRGWGGVTPAIGHFYPQRPVYSLPAGDQIDVIGKKYKLRMVSDFGVFGQAMYEVVGRTGSASANTH
ncbi:MAG TPA: DUF2723 domain-containing protein [Candidatus Binataceae bacterium]|nr:DUF2723 domain-containing protein [Candidatus Binataceae bacterium]